MANDDDDSLQNESSHNSNAVPTREADSQPQQSTSSNEISDTVPNQAAGMQPEEPTASNQFSAEALEQIKEQLKKLMRKNADGHYVCDCNYNAKKRKNHLLNHQLQHCENREVVVRTDIPCPVCKKTFTYDGLKTHLLPFTRPNKKGGTYNAAHGTKTAADHQAILSDIKIKYGPKKY